MTYYSRFRSTWFHRTKQWGQTRLTEVKVHLVSSRIADRQLIETRVTRGQYYNKRVFEVLSTTRRSIIQRRPPQHRSYCKCLNNSILKLWSSSHLELKDTQSWQRLLQACKNKQLAIRGFKVTAKTSFMLKRVERKSTMLIQSHLKIALLVHRRTLRNTLTSRVSTVKTPRMSQSRQRDCRALPIKWTNKWSQRRWLSQSLSWIMQHSTSCINLTYHQSTCRAS